MQHPTRYINIFSHNGKHYAEGEVLETRAAAIEDAEQSIHQYMYTLTDTGVLDLTSEFSEGWHEARDFDAAVDRKIDAMKEGRI